MKGNVNMTGIQEQGKFTLLPEGTYEAEIIEVKDKTSSNGDPLVSIKLIVTEGEFKSQAWVWDNILIPSLESPAAKILGRTKHFLHCIGEPFEGENVEYDSDNWLWKPCVIKVAHEAPNDFHKYPKAVVAEYVLDEDATVAQGTKEESPF